ncbi:MAG: hypothetical protein IJS94_09135, partial [Clostridia bacterium]|nr:hypothetical protein [Clostridia bacterium]
MGIFDYFKKKVSMHNYDSDYVDQNNTDDGAVPGNFFVEDRYEDISFSHPLSVLYHKKTDLPFIDGKGRIWFFSDSDYFQSALNDLCGDLWETLPSEIYIKVYEPEQIFAFLETCYYLYGMDTASLNFEKNFINIRKYVGEVASRYDPSNPNYEISNPVFRYNSVYYNQILQTEFDVPDRLLRLNKLLSKSAKALFGSMLYCPYNMDGNVYSENMVLETENGRYICIYSDAEAVGNIVKETNWRCDRIT